MRKLIVTIGCFAVGALAGAPAATAVTRTVPDEATCGMIAARAHGPAVAQAHLPLLELTTEINCAGIG